MSDSPENGSSIAQALLTALGCVVWTQVGSSAPMRFYGAVERLTGYSASVLDASPELWTELVHPEDRRLLETDRRSACEQQDCIWSWRLVRADGQVVRVRELSSVHRDVATDQRVQQGLIFRIQRRTQDGGPAHPMLTPRMLTGMLRASGFSGVGDPVPELRYAEYERLSAGPSVWTTEQYALAQNDQLLRMLVDRVPTGIALVVGDTVLTNGAIDRMLGYRADELSTVDRWFDTLFPGKSAEVRALHDVDQAAGYPTRRLLWVNHRNGEPRQIEFDGTQSGDAVVWFLNDLTDRVRSDREVAEKSAQITAMLQVIPDQILVLDEDSVALRVQLTEEHRRLFGVKDEDLAGRSMLEMFSVARGQRGKKIIRQVIASGEMSFVEFSLAPPGQHERRFEARISRLSGQSALAIVRDVTEQHQTREQLNRLAFEDVLTGLPNRRSFEQRLQKVIDACAGSDDAVVTVLFVDLDRFKAVNDSFGHRCGDAVLIVIAERLRSVIQDLDIPTRYAGDEFLVLLQHELSCANASLLAESILAAVAQPVPWNGTVVYVTASVGVVHYQANSGTALDCLAQADAAMYRAKSAGRNTVVIFDAHMRQEVARGQRMEAELRHAITTDEIQLFYQPVCDALTSEIVSFEALARWLHPADGVRAAGVFIPLAEDRGIIVPLGYRMIQVACADIARTTQTSSALCHIPIQVNISYHQLAMPGFVSQVRELVHHYQIPPGRLRFEMTETALITDAELAGNLLQQLLEIGISTVMDDFGVGYSSLSYLLQYPLKGLKVDRSFVMQIGKDPKSSLILQTIQQLGNSLGLPVVAEGVETREQLQHLVSLGYRQVQGYLYSQAIPWSEVERKYADNPRIPIVKE